MFKHKVQKSALINWTKSYLIVLVQVMMVVLKEIGEYNLVFGGEDKIFYSTFEGGSPSAYVYVGIVINVFN